ncbi:MAG TPA: ferric reductase-like transmembrane domain-containing protein [Acetobacteraceae bacterium]|nr:ferric reductase-like transmembrane domain-containing protein [Acetobacteraceae bacterium]
MSVARWQSPWHDRSGRFSALKTTVFLLLPLPALAQAIAWVVYGLSGHPSQTALLLSGFWADRLLVLTLAVTPLASLFALPRLVLVRRMLGVAAAAYAAAHLVIYAVQQGFAWGFIAAQMVSHLVLTIGLASLLGLAALALTSTDGWVRRLGRAWKRLHLLAHPATVLALLHSFMEAPSDVTLSATYAGFYLWLLGWRLLPKAWRRHPLALLALALAASAATAALEAGWYALATGLPWARVLAANLSLVAGVRPAQWVALGGLAIAAAVALRLMTRLPASAISLSARE